MEIYRTSDLLFMYPDATKYADENECTPLWTLSTGRCGTQLLSNILALSRDIVSYHEPIPRMWNLSAAGYKLGRNGMKDCPLDVAVRTAKRDIISVARSMNCVYSETNHRNSYLAYILKRIWPKSRFVYLKRNAAGAIASFYHKKMYSKENIYVQDRPEYEPRLDHENWCDPPKPWDKMNDLEKCALNWNRTNQFILDMLRTISLSDWFYLDYDKHIAGRDTDRFLEMFRWLGVSVPDGFDIKIELSKIVNRRKGAYPEVDVDSLFHLHHEPHIDDQIKQATNA